MSLSTNTRDGHIAPSLLAMGIALALFPDLGQAASKSEETLIVEGSTDTASSAQEQDYSVKTTSAGTKMAAGLAADSRGHGRVQEPGRETAPD